MRYASDHNFIGRPIAGYHRPVCILSIAANQALGAVQDELDTLQKGYVLKLFDCYRPVRAVSDFEQWSRDPHDIKGKKDYYPDFEKPALFEQGYIATKSSHSRGSTVDLTISIRNPQDLSQDTELDMGTPFDFFGEKSNTDSPNVSKQAQKNRRFFKELMARHGFENLHTEWWHYTLEQEPFPDTYFDFPVE
jgi:D-alanyl-D-alanine dipeptidase